MYSLGKVAVESDKGAVESGKGGRKSGVVGKKRGRSDDSDSDSGDTMGSDDNSLPFGTPDSQGVISIPRRLISQFQAVFPGFRMVAVLGDGHCLFRAVGKLMVVHPGAVWSWVAAAIAQIGVAGIASLIPGENDAGEWCARSSS
jgi:hypothetical protein